MTKENIVVKYYYIKKSKVTVEYLEKGTERKLDEDVIIEGHEGDQYEIYKKNFEGFVLYSISGNTKGKMTASDEVIKCYYIPENKQGQGSSIDSNDDKSNIDLLPLIGEEEDSNVLPATGDRSDLLILVIEIIIVINILQVEMSKHKKDETLDKKKDELK